MEMYQNGIRIYCLPNGAACEADESLRWRKNEKA